MKKLIFPSIMALMALATSAQLLHNTERDASAPQVRITMADGSELYYYTDEIDDITLGGVDNDAITISHKSGLWQDVFASGVASMSFTKASAAGDCHATEIVSDGIDVIEAAGWYESVWVKWNKIPGRSFRAYIKGGAYDEYTPVDQPLLREYPDYGRVDVPGLPAGTYDLLLTTDDGIARAEIKGMTCRAFSRQGFAWTNERRGGIGAYKNDGSLKDDARVIYVTNDNVNTVQCQMVNNKGEVTLTGLQNILDAYKYQVDNKPLCVRIIGSIEASNVSYFNSTEGFRIRGYYSGAIKNWPINLTIEGVGDDATAHGFGFHICTAESVEIRNLGILWFMDDGVSFDTNCRNLWAHHLDIFYGQPGSDSDQVKGDGSIDLKKDVQYLTIAYNHFWDSGKSCLCGLKAETGPNYISYDHNWFDHSDSRHPRVRTMSVHVWNNYYDGCSGYGVGAARESSVFVDRNYFRATRHPLLISKQGHDTSKTMSGETGGIIKSYANIYAETHGGEYLPYTYQAQPANFDCYEVSDPSETVPSSVKASNGGSTYNNFDTDPAQMHLYDAIDASDIPAHLTGYLGAGRLGHGDFRWTFDNSKDDFDDKLIPELRDAVKNYKSTLIGTYK